MGRACSSEPSKPTKPGVLKVLKVLRVLFGRGSVFLPAREEDHTGGGPESFVSFGSPYSRGTPFMRLASKVWMNGETR
jgi:hypothetical protein